MEKWLKAEGPHLGTIAPTTAIMSTLPLKRSSVDIDMTVAIKNYVEAKIDHIVLYHLSSGQICHTPRQDPLHLEDDITQYMQQGLLQPMVYSSEEVLPSVCPFASVRI